MSVVSYSKSQIIERIEKHINSDFPGNDWKVTKNEMLLYIDAAIPFVMRGQMFENAKVTGVLDVPEAYLVTYNYTISNQDPNTNEYFVTLAQPPLELPTGYDITRCTIASPSTGQSKNGFAISAKRAAYRDNLPEPPGFRYRVEGNTMFLRNNDGTGMIGFALFVQMPVSRTDSLTAELRLPDGAIDAIFTKVVSQILQRFQIPQDQILDNVEQGNKSS